MVTAALLPSEQAAFVQVGFSVHEQLLLFARDLDDLPPVAGERLRRARAADRPAVLDVDRRSFPPFWQLDDDGLQEALDATPRARFRVASGAQPVAGYAVTGRAGRRGYIQRLAVDPDHRRQGIGAALVVDGLHWLRRWRVRRAVVNTQEQNAAAAALYERLGFHREPSGLAVLTTCLR